MAAILKTDIRDMDEFRNMITYFNNSVRKWRNKKVHAGQLNDI